MKLIFSRTLILIVLSVYIFSCGSKDDPIPEQPKPEVPGVTPTFLKLGATYTYYLDDKVFYTDSVKTIVEKQLATDTFLIRNYSESIPVMPTQYWVVKDNAFYTSFRLRDPSTYQIECKFGKPVGTSWQVTKGAFPYTYSIEALNVSITTADGVISDAIKVRIHPPTGTDVFQYVSPSVGMLGNGSDENDTFKLIHYKPGTTNTTTNTIPAITYGTFPFLAVDKFWNYAETSFFSEELIPVTLLIESKLPGNNIYKVKLTYGGDDSYSYWFEDNGMLMVYEEGETVLNADPIYMNESIATVGYGWASMASTGTSYIYTIKSLDTSADTFFGNLSCMEIYVNSGFLSSQTNFWNADKGNVYVSGFIERNVTDSNARIDKKPSLIPFILF